MIVLATLGCKKPNNFDAYLFTFAWKGKHVFLLMKMWGFKKMYIHITKIYWPIRITKGREIFQKEVSRNFCVSKIHNGVGHTKKCTTLKRDIIMLLLFLDYNRYAQILVQCSISLTYILIISIQKKDTVVSPTSFLPEGNLKCPLLRRKTLPHKRL